MLMLDLPPEPVVVLSFNVIPPETQSQVTLRYLSIHARSALYLYANKLTLPPKIYELPRTNCIFIYWE